MNPENPSHSLGAAEDWVRRRDAGLTLAECQDLHAWLAADPRHAQAFAAVDRERTEFDWPLHSGTTKEVLIELRRLARQRRARHRKLIATSIAAMMILTGGIWGWSGLRPHPIFEKTTSTLVVVEPRRQTLPDGSTVELKADAEISIDYDAGTRRVMLRHGTAHFVVNKDPRRPFIVAAGEVAVRAVGTAFSVERDPQQITVLVTEGSVTVNAALMTFVPHDEMSEQSRTQLDRGQTVVLPATATPIPAPIDVRVLPEPELQQKLLWRVPRLEFSGTPLAEVIAAINRHNRQQFELADRQLEKLSLSGVLRADNVDALAAMLASDFAVEVERRDGRIVLHHRTR